MTATQFEELLHLVAPAITKETVIREPLPPTERLSITLRFVCPYLFYYIMNSKIIMFDYI